MSTPTGEPLISADYESREPKELPTWYAVEVAGDHKAMQMALQEFIVRLMFEHGKGWITPYAAILWDAEDAATKEFRAAPINQGVCR